MKLLAKLIAGIIAGIAVGGIYYLVGDGGTMGSIMEFIVRVFVTMQSVLGAFIFFTIPFIILFFIASGISKIGSGSGKVVGATLGVAYLSTLGAGLLAYAVASFVMPRITGDSTVPEEGAAIAPFLEFDIPPVMDILPALVLAFAVGIVMNILKLDLMIKFFDQGKDITEFIIEKVIIRILPFYIAGVFAGMAATGTVFDTLLVFGVVLLVAIILHWVWLVLQYTIAGSLLKQNPFKMLKTMLPAYFTALGTMSSAATIPVTLARAKENGIRGRIADFVVPLIITKKRQQGTHA